MKLPTIKTTWRTYKSIKATVSKFINLETEGLCRNLKIEVPVDYKDKEKTNFWKEIEKRAQFIDCKKLWGGTF